MWLEYILKDNPDMIGAAFNHLLHTRPPFGRNELKQVLDESILGPGIQILQLSVRERMCLTQFKGNLLCGLNRRLVLDISEYRIDGLGDLDEIVFHHAPACTRR